jgi:hypothetical protein
MSDRLLHIFNICISLSHECYSVQRILGAVLLLVCRTHAVDVLRIPWNGKKIALVQRYSVQPAITACHRVWCGRMLCSLAHLASWSVLCNAAMCCARAVWDVLCMCCGVCCGVCCASVVGCGHVLYIRAASMRTWPVHHPALCRMKTAQQVVHPSSAAAAAAV